MDTFYLALLTKESLLQLTFSIINRLVMIALLKVKEAFMNYGCMKSNDL
jgi:hypothetical protein